MKTAASFSDTLISFDDSGHLDTLLIVKRVDFKSYITNVLVLLFNTPSSPTYGVLVSQFIQARIVCHESQMTS